MNVEIPLSLRDLQAQRGAPCLICPDFDPRYPAREEAGDVLKSMAGTPEEAALRLRRCKNCANCKKVGNG